MKDWLKYRLEHLDDYEVLDVRYRLFKYLDPLSFVAVLRVGGVVYFALCKIDNEFDDRDLLLLFDHKSLKTFIQNITLHQNGQIKPQAIAFDQKDPDIWREAQSKGSQKAIDYINTKSPNYREFDDFTWQCLDLEQRVLRMFDLKLFSDTYFHLHLRTHQIVHVKTGEYAGQSYVKPRDETKLMFNKAYELKPFLRLLNLLLKRYE